ncbi:uncharacterized protein LOC114356842, partial [Ostrinia furnacalis]|uniref:uncharacterized protein LOC114356842 n=1 Tax=Ostrinia furnacalis TaxID=93504 RepID=UPI00103F31B7
MQVVGGAQDPGPLLARRARELGAAGDRLAAAAARAQALVTAAHQRVKWGAGANPALSSVVVSLERAWAARRARAHALAAGARQLSTHARRASMARAAAARHKHAKALRTSLAHWEK